MPTTGRCLVKNMKLDLNNFRTLPHKSEIAEIRAIVSANPDWFWALAESLLDDGYHPTENILVLRQGKKLIVKEGNRRIGALKLIFGYIKRNGIQIPSHIEEKIKSRTPDWKKENQESYCQMLWMGLLVRRRLGI
jgi:hypothetical protein